MTTVVLECDQVVLPEGLAHDVQLTITDGVISAVRVGPVPPDPPALGPATRVSGTVVPGFIDTHVHGGGGADLATTDPDEARRAIGFHRSHGTTTMFASLVTAELEVLCAQLTALAGLCAAGELAGIHLEGPFLSEHKCGAHDPALLRPPTPAEVERLLDAGDGHLRMITVAPELAGADAAIDRFVAAGVVVAVGHTDAGPEQVASALTSGATVATHLFNAMPTIHHRIPGPVPLLLTDPGVMVELICDGVHVHPDVIALAIRAAGPSRVALITDAMAAAGMPDGEYRIGDLHVHVNDAVARLATPTGEPGSIAGSTLTMADAFAYTVNVVGANLADAAVMAATTPAAWHGLVGRGAIDTGAVADLVVVDDLATTRAVMRQGRWLTGPPGLADWVGPTAVDGLTADDRPAGPGR
ncbi:MAG: N-acetylglucosamine-6-phosphate deacetylase [Propionibacteriaceae bacterium]